jgi:hypothetical protein
MWSMAFVATYTGVSWGGATYPPKDLTNAKQTTKAPAMPPEPTKATTMTRAIEILMSVEQAESIVPTFSLHSEKKSRQHLRKACGAEMA